MSRRLSVYRYKAYDPKDPIPHEMMRLVSEKHLVDRERAIMNLQMSGQATPSLRREYVQVTHEIARRNPNPPRRNQEPPTRSTSPA